MFQKQCQEKSTHTHIITYVGTCWHIYIYIQMHSSPCIYSLPVGATSCMSFEYTYPCVWACLHRCKPWGNKLNISNYICVCIARHTKSCSPTFPNWLCSVCFSNSPWNFLPLLLPFPKLTSLQAFPNLTYHRLSQTWLHCFHYLLGSHLNFRFEQLRN